MLGNRGLIWPSALPACGRERYRGRSLCGYGRRQTHARVGDDRMAGSGRLAGSFGSAPRGFEFGELGGSQLAGMGHAFVMPRVRGMLLTARGLTCLLRGSTGSLVQGPDSAVPLFPLG
jgi:hypothetical protein